VADDKTLLPGIGRQLLEELAKRDDKT